MIGVDTNILVRYICQDDPKQCPIVDDLISEAEQRGDILFVNTVVLCELVWVLESAYGFSKVEIVQVVKGLLSARQLEIEARDDVRRASEAFAQGRGDFSDHLIGYRNRSRGCEHTVTFDRAADGVNHQVLGKK